ncbi:MAG TPA: hypothetical protein ENN12_04175 [Epsilonproteobacteria bacterium]|nr:hypothetical protein [Campylobacterota bacterium]
MIAEAIMYHLAIVKILLVVLSVNLLTPWLVKQSYSKWIRSGFFLFSAFLGMVIFSGLILFILMGASWSLRTILMSIVAFILIILEVQRVRTISKYWKDGNNIALVSAKFVLLEIFLLVATTIWLVASK